jgi:hypothetical protein
MDAKKKDEKFDFVGDEKVAEAPPIPDGINVKSVEVAGVLVDAQGNKWTIPEKDEVDVRYKSLFTIPRPDPLMSYQFIRKEELTEYLGEQWVPVKREEIGVATFITEKNEYGDALDSYHVVGTQICVKKPKVLVDRTYAAQQRVCAAAVGATEPPPPGKDPKEQSARNGAQRGQRRYTLARKTENVSPKNPDNEFVSATE